jgi:hypothetical protein
MIFTDLGSKVFYPDFAYVGIALSLENTPIGIIWSNNEEDMLNCLPACIIPSDKIDLMPSAIHLVEDGFHSLMLPQEYVDQNNVKEVVIQLRDNGYIRFPWQMLRMVDRF